MSDDSKETLKEEELANQSDQEVEEDEENENEEEESHHEDEQNEDAVSGKKLRLSRKASTAKLREEIKQLKEKNDELKDKYLRLFADFDNYKKRAAKEKLEFMKEAGKDVVINLLPVLDDFERAMKTMESSDNVAAVKEGSQLIYNKLKTSLEQKGVKKMESIGKDFDPEFHEAIAEVPAPTEEQKGKVIDEVEKGYFLNDKIIRYAKVVVGK